MLKDVRDDTPISSLDILGKAMEIAEYRTAVVHKPSPHSAPRTANASARLSQQEWLEREMSADAEEDEEDDERGKPYVFGESMPAGLKLHWESDLYCTIRVEAILPGGQAEKQVRRRRSGRRCAKRACGHVREPAPPTDPCLVAPASRAQGLTVGSRLVRINHQPVKEMDEETVRKLVAVRPVTMWFMPPEAVYTQVRPRGTAVAYTFGDETPTGLRLHWEETEGVVSIVGINAGGEAERQGLVVGSQLERVNGRPMAGIRPDELTMLIAERPLTLHFVPPEDAQMEQRGVLLACEFDQGPTGLKLHWDEGELGDARVVRVSSVDAGSQAEVQVRAHSPMASLPAVADARARSRAAALVAFRRGSSWALSWRASTRRTARPSTRWS